VKIVKRSIGKSSVSSAAYRSGSKLTNEWDGVTHDYTHKGGVVHSEILLPAHAPPAFADRSTLWNSVEQSEKSKNAQLAREIEVALPVELTREAQLKLVRTYIQDNFVSAGMCADFSIHDKKDGNPHAHIMLTIRPLNDNGTWGAKCRKVYDLDEHGKRIPDGKGGWKNHREDTTNWNDKGNVERWREAWAMACNEALEQEGHPERVDHRSYKRQGVKQIPSVHMGVAATQMEQRGIVTEKGEINRQITADNKLLKEIQARLARLYKWSKEHPQIPEPKGKQSIREQLWHSHQKVQKQRKPNLSTINSLKENAALFNFLQNNNIDSMQQLYDKIAAMNNDFYKLRSEIVATEKRITMLDEQIKMYKQYKENLGIYKKLIKMKPGKQAAFIEQHRAELTMFDTALRFLKKVEAGGEKINIKRWQNESIDLTLKKNQQYEKMRDMRDKIKTVENLRKAAERLAKDGLMQTKPKER